MITGRVTAGGEAVISVRVRGPAGAETDIDAVIDTGFTDCLTLPPSVISALGLPYEAPTQAILAANHVIVMHYHRGSVWWQGAERNVLILEAEGVPLVGMALRGSDLHMRVIDGGELSIEPVP